MKQSLFLFVFSVIFVSIIFCQTSSSDFIRPYYFDDNSNHYILDKEFVHNQYGNDIELFCTPYKSGLVWVDNNTLLGFILDPSWNKLVYRNYLGGLTKIHGRWGRDEYGWHFPNGITTDGLGNIYVADIENGRVKKLKYANDEISQPANALIGVNYLQRPWDLDIDDRGNQYTSDDIIWVVDRGRGEIIPFTTNGTIWNECTITSLYNASTGQYYNDLSYVMSIAIRKVVKEGVGVNSSSNRRLYLLDPKLKKLFLVEADVPENGVAQIYKELNLSSLELPYDIESDYFGDVWVLDTRGAHLYKYTWDLTFITKSSEQFNVPTGVTSSRRHHLNIAVNERWTANTGNRTYFHGADIKNLQISTGYTSANFSFTMTNWNYLIAQIWKHQSMGFDDLILVATLSDGSTVHPSGNVSLNWYNSNPQGTYRLYLTALSYERNDPDYKVSKKIRRDFTFGKPPLKKTVNDIVDLPEKFSVQNNYPNPFNNTTIIHIELPEDTEIKLEVYNLLGRKVDVIEKGIKKAGRYDILWNASSLPSGIYIVNLKAGTFIKSYKAVLLK